MEDSYSNEDFEEDNGYVHRGNGWDSAANRSVNAVLAEKQGRYALNDWKKKTKSEILSRINHIIDMMGGAEKAGFDVCLLKKAQKSALLTLFLVNNGEYHHVKVKTKRGFFRNELYFYEISVNKLKTTTNQMIESAIFDIWYSNQVKKQRMMKRKNLEQGERLASPLAIGIFSQRDYYYRKWQSTFTTYIGIIDGDYLYYYDFPKDSEDRVHTKEELKNVKIRKKTWPGIDSYKHEDVHTFKTYKAFVKMFPQYEYKTAELKLLKAKRKQDRKTTGANPLKKSSS